VKDLSNKQLQTIPPCEANCTVTTLILNGNQISLNESDRLALVSYYGLSQLYLDNNIVIDIKAKYFSGVPSLKALSLSANKISRLNPEAFSGLEGLTELDLSNNSLSSIPDQLLNTFKNPQVGVSYRAGSYATDGHIGSSRKVNKYNFKANMLLKYSISTVFTASSFTATCASPQSMLGLPLTEAIAKCSLAPTTIKPTSSKTPHILKAILTPQFNRSLGKDEPVAQGNSWKFTISVLALVLTTAVVIVCAIKGPSWYRLFHNYQHRRLHNQTTEPTGTTVFQQTYSFEEEGRRKRRGGDEVEDEDGYFEDPYIRREE
ncbi:hypothetical protein NQD34_014863, partial [Periophthalmus magnuspinnatus]